MKTRTDFHSVNLSTGERTRSIVGDGQEIDEVVGPRTPAATQEQPAGSGASNLTPSIELAVRKLEEASMAIHDLPHESRKGFQWVKTYDALKILADSQHELLASQPLKEGISERAGSPRKVGEDGPVKPINPAMVEALMLDAAMIYPISSDGYFAWLAEQLNRNVAHATRPSSVPVGEQKQEEGV